MSSFPQSKKYCSLTKGKILGQGRGRWAVSQNIKNTALSLRAKCWVRGGVGGQFPRI